MDAETWRCAGVHNQASSARSRTANRKQLRQQTARDGAAGPGGGEVVVLQDDRSAVDAERCTLVQQRLDGARPDGEKRQKVGRAGGATALVMRRLWIWTEESRRLLNGRAKTQSADALVLKC